MSEHEGMQSSVEVVCTEEELEDSKKEFQTLFNLMPDPVAIVDQKGKFLAVNDKVEEITGFKREELLEKNFLRIEIATAKSKAILIKNLAKRMMGMHIAPYEIEGLTKNGKKIPLEVNATKIEYGKKPADLVTFRDITERKKAEEALRESEEKFRNLAEQSPNMIFINRKGRIVYANKKCEDVTGYKKKEFYSPDFSFLTLIAPESVDLVKSNFSRHIKGKDVIPYEYRLVTKEGKKIEAILTAKLIKYEGENAILGTVTDITERKKMEEKLRQYSQNLEELVRVRTEELLESEKRYSVLVEEASDGVAMVQDGKVIFANKKAAEIIGYSIEEIIGLPFENVVDEKYLPLATEGYMRIMRGETVPPLAELELMAKTGERVPVEASSTLIKYLGRLANLVIIRDITERKRMEEERLKLEKLAAVGEVATMVGHDLRNPLQAIENAAYYLNNELPNLSTSIPTPQKTREMLQVINDSVSYADKIVRDLRDFSATKKITLTKTNINTIVEETLSQVERPENMKVITKLSHLPKMKADKDMIKRVFLNLTMNGIQAMEKGGTLKVLTRKTKGFVEVSFKDTGVGISKE
ncbi:MAG: PAS domain S-box protein, partial [Candidatus Bathyarchaeota archaeon]|nr:PAS domain S-box protein [Candidatus Bathyarchaeota archaeon]